jgi:F-type H+-transporting ATPase subunit b
MHAALFLDAGPLTINGTFIVEVIAFILMVVFLAKVPLPFLGIPKPVYPWLISIAEARQRAITEELEAAEKARVDADSRLKDADAKLADARRTADTIVEGANRSAEQLRSELRQKAEAEYQRIIDSAQKDIDAERERALQTARDEVAGMVVAATQRVIGETLDEPRHRRLIERAIQEVAGGDGSR